MELSLTTLFVAFSGGVLMFLAPCTLPLVPAFLASLVPNGEREKHTFLRSLTLKTIYFCIGFTTLFVLFGILTGLFGLVFASYKLLLSQIGGIFIILFGLSLMNVVRIPIIQKSVSHVGKIALNNEKKSTPVFLGALFALGWTPCAGPILASILFLASEEGTALSGGLLLFAFSLGLAIPFILLGILYAHTMSIFNWYTRYATAIRILSGLFLIILGIIIVFGHSIVMTHWGFALYSFFGYTPMCTIL